MTTANLSRWIRAATLLVSPRKRHGLMQASILNLDNSVPTAVGTVLPPGGTLLLRPNGGQRKNGNRKYQKHCEVPQNA